jgi:hypothetical protein
MRESTGMDSILEGAMPRPYSQDLRMWVIEAAEGGASREALWTRFG